MLQLFRNIFKSKIGVALTLGFLALIGLAFASSDIANTGVFGGIAGGERVASVGDREITTADLSMTTSNALTSIRQQNPTMTMEGFISGGGIDDVLDQMITRTSIMEYGHRFGLRTSNRLIDSEIVNMPEFRGLDGNFSEDGFRQALQQRGLSESAVRDDFAKGLMARQLLLAIDQSPRMPGKIATRYARLLQERRNGRIAAVIAAPFAPTEDPEDAALETYYEDNRDNYIRPERRVIRYAVFDAATLANVPDPTEEQIAARYQRDAADYAALETRSFTQLVVPTQAAAQAIVDEVAGGKSLEVAAREKGLRTSPFLDVPRSEMAADISEGVATTAFATARGALTAPTRGQLGWYVLRVDGVDERPARSLEQVRGEIVEQLSTEMRRTALGDATVQIEDDFADGRSLSEVAEDLGLQLQASEPLTAAGLVYGTSQQAPQELARVIATAFDMDEGEPQLAEIAPGTQFVIYDVSDITASATAPLADIRPQVVAAWRRDEAMNAAGAASRRILDRVEEGSTLAEAVAAEEVRLPAPESLSLSRQDLARGGEVPRPLALMFSMAQGTTKRLESPESQAWFVIALDEIDVPEIAGDAPLVQQARTELARTVGEEDAGQFVAAVQDEVEVERNQTAIDVVIAQLTGNLN